MGTPEIKKRGKLKLGGEERTAEERSENVKERRKKHTKWSSSEL